MLWRRIFNQWLSKCDHTNSSNRIAWKIVRNANFGAPTPDLLNQKLQWGWVILRFSKPSGWFWYSLTFVKPCLTVEETALRWDRQQGASSSFGNSHWLAALSASLHVLIAGRGHTAHFWDEQLLNRWLWGITCSEFQQDSTVIFWVAIICQEMC